MCKNCIYSDFDGTCTEDKCKGYTSEKQREEKIIFFENFYNTEKCDNCIFQNQCDYLSTNYKDDFCQSILKILEERL